MGTVRVAFTVTNLPPSKVTATSSVFPASPGVETVQFHIFAHPRDGALLAHPNVRPPARARPRRALRPPPAAASATSNQVAARVIEDAHIDGEPRKEEQLAAIRAAKTSTCPRPCGVAQRQTFYCL